MSFSFLIFQLLRCFGQSVFLHIFVDILSIQYKKNSFPHLSTYKELPVVFIKIIKHYGLGIRETYQTLNTDKTVQNCILKYTFGLAPVLRKEELCWRRFSAAIAAGEAAEYAYYCSSYGKPQKKFLHSTNGQVIPPPLSPRA